MGSFTSKQVRHAGSVDWHSLAATIDVPRDAFIGGRYVAAASGERIPTFNPGNGEKLADVAACDQSDVDAAVATARRAFDNGPWSRMSATERKHRMLRWAEALEDHAEEIALLESLNVGKPIRNAYELDVPKGIKAIRWYAELVDKLYDQIAPTRRDAMALITREPLGVIGIVIAWNYPFYMSCYKTAPAIALGNSVVLKPSEYAPHSALIIAQAAAEAGIPDGVINVVTGSGPAAGRAIGLHPDVDTVSFTGSTPTGKAYLRYAAESNMKRVTLECGGKSPQIVLADCGDLEPVVEGLAMGIFYNQGEVCNAGSRLVIDRSIRDEVVSRLLDKAKRFEPRDPLDPAGQMGAIVSSVQHSRILRYIETGEREGAKLVLDGKAHNSDKGWFVGPTVFTDVSNDMTIAREEIFGPVLSVIDCDSPEDAIRIANDTSYGLAASVWTRDITRALRISQQLRAGNVWINSFNTSDMSTPFGGFKLSGNGKDKSHHALEKYCEYKNVWIELSA